MSKQFEKQPSAECDAGACLSRLEEATAIQNELTYGSNSDVLRLKPSSDWFEGNVIGSNRRAHSCKTSWPTISHLVDKATLYFWVDRFFLATCFIVILFVSAADTWFAALNANILNKEANPICLWLLQLDSNSCGYFLAGKTCGTLVVLTALFWLLRMKYKHARLIIGAVTLFQFFLLTYLFLSDPLMDNWINFELLGDNTEPSVFWKFHELNFKPG